MTLPTPTSTPTPTPTPDTHSGAPLAERYLAGLLDALPPDSRAELAHSTGATPAQLERLRAAYPLCPDSLLRLLARHNGSYYEPYHDDSDSDSDSGNGGGNVLVYMFGSDMFEYPYYLSSVEQILEDRQANQRSIADIYGAYLQDDPEIVDARIDATVKQGQRLCFSHCMNNGGTSRLYVDFSPTPAGKCGQVVRFLHDPDSYLVIADNFDAYLQMLIDDDYAFLAEENFD